MKKLSQRYGSLPRRPLGLFLLLTGFIVTGAFGAAPLSAESMDGGVTEVALYALPAEGTADSRLIDLIQSSLALEVERAGFPVTVLHSPPQPGVQGTVLLCYVSADGEQIGLEMIFTSEDRPELNNSSTQEGKIDLGFDALIARGLSKILDHVLALAPELSGREPVSTAIRAASEAGPSVNRETGTGSDSEPEPKPTNLQPGDQVAGPVTPDLPFKPWKISVGAAPFIVVGRVNLYFNLGVLSSLRGGYTFRTRAGDIETGVFLGVNYFSALGLETRSFNYLLPMGASVRYGGQFGPRLQAFLSLTGGAALFILKPEEEPQLMKVTGYVGAGTGAGFLLGKWFGVALEVDYFVFFEQYYPIMGVVPSVYFEIRL